MAEVTSVAASTRAATASWPTASTPPRGASTAPASSARVTGRTRTRVRAGLVAVAAGPPPDHAEHPEEGRHDPAAALGDDGREHGRTEHEEHREQLAAPAAGQVQPTERDQAGEQEPQRRLRPSRSRW